MKYFKIIILALLFCNVFNITSAKEIHFIDMRKVLNESNAGKAAQDFLKKKFENENKKFEKEGSALKKEESDLISKKKLISPDEYKNKLNDLRKKNIAYQKKKRNASNQWVSKKNEARAKLMNALNPIMQKYMKENNIEIIVDKKYVLMANSNFEITDKILKILNQEVKSINLK